MTRGRSFVFAVFVALAASALSIACTGSHACTSQYVDCDQTTLSLQAPGNAWPPGLYTLNLDIGGRLAQCTLTMPDSPPTSVVTGGCSESDLALTLTPVCPQPAPVCGDGACESTASSANCLAGQFEAAVVLSPTLGADASTGLAAQVNVDLTLNNTVLLQTTTVPTVITTEPNGEGCGTCVNAASTLVFNGG